MTTITRWPWSGSGSCWISTLKRRRPSRMRMRSCGRCLWRLRNRRSILWFSPLLSTAHTHTHPRHTHTHTPHPEYILLRFCFKNFAVSGTDRIFLKWQPPQEISFRRVYILSHNAYTNIYICMFNETAIVSISCSVVSLRFLYSLSILNCNVFQTT